MNDDEPTIDAEGDAQAEPLRRTPPLPLTRRSAPEQEREQVPLPRQPAFDLGKRTEALKDAIYAEADNWSDATLPDLIHELLGVTRVLSKNYLKFRADRAAKARAN